MSGRCRADRKDPPKRGRLHGVNALRFAWDPARAATEAADPDYLLPDLSAEALVHGSFYLEK